MKDAKVTQTITLTIEGKSFKLTTEEAIHLRDQLNNIICPSSHIDKWREAFKKGIYINTEPAHVPQWTPGGKSVPMGPQITCSAS